MTITKSITIDCEDTQGSILASLVNGVILNGANIDVRLRGISINGAGNGINCIRVLNSGVKLTLDEIVCSGFTQHGISLENSGGTNKVTVRNSSFRQLTGNGINTFLSGLATVNIAVEKSLFSLCNIGVNLGLASNASVMDSTLRNNTTGAQASGSTSALALTRNQITHTTTGIIAGSSANIRIGGNVVTGNGTGLSGTNILTWGGNFVDGNSPGGNGTNNGNAAVQ